MRREKAIACLAQACALRTSRGVPGAAPGDDCVTTKVVMGAQYASGSRNNRAASSEATAATAVRAECMEAGSHLTHSIRPLPIFCVVHETTVKGYISRRLASSRFRSIS